MIKHRPDPENPGKSLVEFGHKYIERLGIIAVMTAHHDPDVREACHLAMVATVDLHRAFHDEWPEGLEPMDVGAMARAVLCLQREAQALIDAAGAITDDGKCHHKPTLDALRKAVDAIEHGEGIDALEIIKGILMRSDEP